MVKTLLSSPWGSINTISHLQAATKLASGSKQYTPRLGSPSTRTRTSWSPKTKEIACSKIMTLSPRQQRHWGWRASIRTLTTRFLKKKGFAASKISTGRAREKKGEATLPRRKKKISSYPSNLLRRRKRRNGKTKELVAQTAFFDIFLFCNYILIQIHSLSLPNAWFDINFFAERMPIEIFKQPKLTFAVVVMDNQRL